MGYDLARIQDTLDILHVSCVCAGVRSGKLTSILSSAVKPWM